MHLTFDRKRIVTVVFTVGALACFGFGYFQSAQKSWSWPIALLLACAWGAVCVLWVGRTSRPAEKPEGQHESDAKKEHS
jgi:predicted outer membrane lipoprotein